MDVIKILDMICRKKYGNKYTSDQYKLEEDKYLEKKNKLMEKRDLLLAVKKKEKEKKEILENYILNEINKNADLKNKIEIINDEIKILTKKE